MHPALDKKAKSASDAEHIATFVKIIEVYMGLSTSTDKSHVVSPKAVAWEKFKWKVIDKFRSSKD